MGAQISLEADMLVAEVADITAEVDAAPAAFLLPGAGADSTPSRPVVVELTEVIRQGARGAKGDKGDPGDAIVLPAAGPIIAYKLVTTDESGRVIYVSSGSMEHYGLLLGIAVTAAGQAGDPVTIQSNGIVQNDGWSWVPHELLYVGLNGDLVRDQHGVFYQVVGYAVSPTEVFLRFGRPVVRAS